MTDLTTAQLATILSALAGTARKPATKAAAVKAIARSAATLGLSTDAVLAAAPGLLDGRLDPAAWREQLTAPVQPSQGERIAASLKVAFPELPAYLEITASGEQAMLVDRRGKATVLTADSDDAATHARWRRAIRKLAQQHATADILPGDQPAPLEVPEAEPVDASGSAEPSHRCDRPAPGDQAGAGREPARPRAGRHAGRADRRHRLAAAHHPGRPHRPAPQGLLPSEGPPRRRQDGLPHPGTHRAASGDAATSQAA